MREKTYIDETRKATQVIWLGRIAVLNQQYVVQLATDDDLISLFKITGLGTRQCSIGSYDAWESFSESCYLVRYKTREGVKTALGCVQMNRCRDP